MPDARDRLGRPVAIGSADAFPTVPERADVDGGTAWREALAYVDEGLPFHAHEVFEQRWRCCPEAERLAWQALAQWGAALTHRARGNDTGMRRLAERARLTLDAAGQPPSRMPMVIDVELVRSSLDELD